MEKYEETKDIASKESLKLYSEVRKISSQDVSLIIVRDYSENTLNLTLATKNWVAKMKRNLENIPIPDMIHLHKQTRDITFTDVLKSNSKLSKLQTNKSKIENQLRKEKAENRAHHVQIKKLHIDLLVIESQVDKGAGIQKFLSEKENIIQILKNKLKIPSTQIIQASE